MSFWISALCIAGLAGALLALAMARGRRGSISDQNVQVYRDQLNEVDRDLARGVVGMDEAARVRVEVSRRLLEADQISRNSNGEPVQSSSAVAGWVICVVLIAVAFGIYYQIGARNYRDLPLASRIAAAVEAHANRPSQSEAEIRLGGVLIDPNTDARMLDLMVKLRAALVERPSDLKGHILLAQNEAALGDFVAAHKAQARVVALKGSNATTMDYSDYADMMVLAAGGYVSPEAEVQLTKSLQLDPDNGTSRYYAGLMFSQNRRPDKAFQIWRDLLKESDAKDPWVAPIRTQIEEAAYDAGERYTLAPLVDALGPTAQDIEAATDMSDEDRDQMIRGMVTRLSDRLAAQGGPASDWARLIGALGVLGERERATAIWGEAQTVFGADAQGLNSIRDAARRAGVTE